MVFNLIRKKMLVASFLTSLLVTVITNCDNACGAPTPEEENHLNDHRPLLKANKFSLDKGSDPIQDVPGEPLSPEDFQNAELLPLEPPLKDVFHTGSSEINGLFEGDIAGFLPRDTIDSPRKETTKKLQNAIVDVSLLWPSGIVPYVISASFDKTERSVIAKAILEYHNKSCIRFVPRTNQEDYLKIMSGLGCSSHVGRTKGEQQVSLGRGCIHVGIIMHELMHAVGFWHEQSRTDRDDHIIIHWENIIEDMTFNFDKYDRNRIQDLGAAYDTGSIMHYDAYAFAKNRNYPTITSKKPGKELGQRQGFSNTDLFKLNKLYKCNINSTQQVSTTTLPPAVTTVVRNKTECNDENKYCQIWKVQGECEKNPWMNVHCRKSCNRCDGCHDFNDNCAAWAEAGECPGNEYMKDYCRLSCGFCSEPPAVSAKMNCVDNHRNCKVWAANKNCRSNPEFMLINCKKSCREC